MCVCVCLLVQNMQLKTQSKHVHRQMCVSERTNDRQQSKLYRLFACTHTDVALCVCVCLEPKRSHIYTHRVCVCLVYYSIYTYIENKIILSLVVLFNFVPLFLGVSASVSTLNLSVSLPLTRSLALSMTVLSYVIAMHACIHAQCNSTDECTFFDMGVCVWITSNMHRNMAVGSITHD